MFRSCRQQAGLRWGVMGSEQRIPTDVLVSWEEGAGRDPAGVIADVAVRAAPCEPPPRHHRLPIPGWSCRDVLGELLPRAVGRGSTRRPKACLAGLSGRLSPRQNYSQPIRAASDREAHPPDDWHVRRLTCSDSTASLALELPP